MRRRDRAAAMVIGAALALAPCTVAARENTLQHLRDSDLRVATVGYRLLTRNHALCPKRGSATGLVLHSLRQYGNAVREEALHEWKFPSPVSVEAIVPGSPAQVAGLRPSDGIEAVNDRRFASGGEDRTNATSQRDQLEQYLSGLDNTSLIKIYISRDGKSITSDLKPSPACSSRIEVVAGEAIKARSDGKTIQIGQGFAQRLDDEELAFVLAHELAHTIRGHRETLASLESSGTRAAKRQRQSLARQFEDEADLLALHLLQNAGWDPGTAPRFMRTKGREFDLLLPGGTHRRASERAKRMEEAIARRPMRLAAPAPADF